MVRFGIAAIGFGLVGWQHLSRATATTWLTGISLGLFLTGIFVAETFGVKHTTAIAAGFLISLNVVLVPWVEKWILHYPIHWALMVSMVIALGGTALVTSSHGGQFVVNLGDGLILLAASLRAIQMTVTKRWVSEERIDIIALNVIQFMTVWIVCGGLTAITSNSLTIINALKSVSFWLVAGYLGLLGTVAAFVIQMVSIRHTSAARAALLLGLEPAFSALFGVIGGERLSLSSAIGGGLIVAGTLWGQQAEYRRRLEIENRT